MKRISPQYRLPQAAVAVAPVFASHFGQSSFVWPPLGNLETYGSYIAVIAIGLFSLFPKVFQAKDRARTRLGCSIALVIVLSLLYAFLLERYVITVDTPANGPQTRSVGFVVEPRIRELFPDKNDLELLRIGGLEDWQIKKVWTPTSVDTLRLSLLATYILILGLANVALGTAAEMTP